MSLFQVWKNFKKKDYSFGMMTVGPEETLKQLKKYLKVKSIDALEAEWHGYVEQNLNVQSARGFERAARMALRNGLLLRAKRYYRKAVESGNASGSAYFGYGRALLFGRRRPAAGEWRCYGGCGGCSVSNR